MRFSILTLGSLLALSNNIGVQARAIPTELAVSNPLEAQETAPLPNEILKKDNVFESDFSEHDTDFLDDEILKRQSGLKTSTSKNKIPETQPTTKMGPPKSQTAPPTKFNPNGGGQ